MEVLPFGMTQLWWLVGVKEWKFWRHRTDDLWIIHYHLLWDWSTEHCDVAVKSGLVFWGWRQDVEGCIYTICVDWWQEFYAVAWTTLTFNSDGVQNRSNILAVGGMLNCYFSFYHFTHTVLKAILHLLPLSKCHYIDMH